MQTKEEEFFTAIQHPIYLSAQLKCLTSHQIITCLNKELTFIELNKMIGEQFSIFMQLEPLFSNPFLYKLAKSICNNFINLLIIKIKIVEPEEQIDNKIIHVSEKTVEPSTIVESQVNKLGGIHLYNENYNNGIETIVTTSECEKEEEEEVVKEYDEIANYIIETKKKDSFFNYSAADMQLESMVMTLTETEKEAWKFLAGIKEEKEFNKFEFKEVEKEVKKNCNKIKNNIISKLKSVLENHEKKEIEKKEEAIFSNLIQVKFSKEVQTEEELDKNEISNKKFSKENILNTKKDIYFELANIKMVLAESNENKKIQEEEISNLKKLLKEEKSKRNDIEKNNNIKIKNNIVKEMDKNNYEFQKETKNMVEKLYIENNAKRNVIESKYAKKSEDFDLNEKKISKKENQTSNSNEENDLKQENEEKIINLKKVKKISQLNKMLKENLSNEQMKNCEVNEKNNCSTELTTNTKEEIKENKENDKTLDKLTENIFCPEEELKKNEKLSTEKNNLLAFKKEDVEFKETIVEEQKKDLNKIKKIENNQKKNKMESLEEFKKQNDNLSTLKNNEKNKKEENKIEMKEISLSSLKKKENVEKKIEEKQLNNLNDIKINEKLLENKLIFEKNKSEEKNLQQFSKEIEFEIEENNNNKIIEENKEESLTMTENLNYCGKQQNHLLEKEQPIALNMEKIITEDVFEYFSSNLKEHQEQEFENNKCNKIKIKQSIENNKINKIIEENNCEKREEEKKAFETKILFLELEREEEKEIKTEFSEQLLQKIESTKMLLSNPLISECESCSQKKKFFINKEITKEHNKKHESSLKENKEFKKMCNIIEKISEKKSDLKKEIIEKKENKETFEIINKEDYVLKNFNIISAFESINIIATKENFICKQKKEYEKENNNNLTNITKNNESKNISYNNKSKKNSLEKNKFEEICECPLKNIDQKIISIKKEAKSKLPKIRERLTNIEDKETFNENNYDQFLKIFSLENNTCQHFKENEIFKQQKIEYMLFKRGKNELERLIAAFKTNNIELNELEQLLLICKIPIKQIDNKKFFKTEVLAEKEKKLIEEENYDYLIKNREIVQEIMEKKDKFFY